MRCAVRGLELDDNALAVLFDADASLAREIRLGNANRADGATAGLLLMLVRLHRGLGDVYGSTDRMNQWLDTTEPELNARPRDLMRTPEGLARVVANVESRCKDCLW